MNVLFVIHPTSNFQLNQSEDILEIFEKENFNVNVIALKYYDKFCSLKTAIAIYRKLDEINSIKYDIAIAFNKGSLSFISEFVEKNNLPLLYLTNEADLPAQYPVNLSLISRIILLQQSGEKVNLPLPAKLVRPIRFFSCSYSKQKESKPNNRKFKQILIGFSQRELARSEIAGRIPLFNMLFGFRIVLLSDGKDFTPITSSRIKVLNSKKIKLHKHIAEADIIIGSGDIIMEAIKQFKPCIIVGERGFGGTLEPEVFKSRFRNGFLGRVGGYPGEFIPERVLLDSLKDIVQWDTEKLNFVTTKNYELLVQEKEAGDKKMVETIHQIVSSHKMLTNNLMNQTLKFSGLFALRLLPNKKFLLVNNILRREEAFFDEDEFKIVKSFAEGCKVEDALKKSDYAGEPETFLQFVRELVNEKILELNGQE